MTALTWRKPDDYHIRSECGRFTVARMNVVDSVWYAAFKLPWSESEPSTEIAATKLSANASDAERMAAIRELQSVCETAA
jgi:hypothetical protein